MVAMFASFAAWLFPSFGVLRKGFDNPSRLDLGTFTVLACWYLLIFVSFNAGEKVGGLLVLRRSTPPAQLLNLKSNIIYYGFTLLSTAGIAATLIRVFQLLPLQQAIAAIALGQTNAAKRSAVRRLPHRPRFSALLGALSGIYRSVPNHSIEVIYPTEYLQCPPVGDECCPSIFSINLYCYTSNGCIFA